MKRHACHRAGPLARRAFTMMEVLVVIVILAILLALVSTVVRRVMVASEVEKTKGNMTLVMRALERYYDDKAQYPTALVDLFSVDACRELLSNTTCIDSSGIMIDGFGNQIVYLKEGGRGKRPLLTSPGPDKTLGNSDDISVP
ncbi:MAG: prepilin-type N-terminal cleavage/methylation domain-containing protein [Planctomycetota bacterium]|nr:prepilin-type N-terminal cleavage/methylation domain-containing protein [Planctomycetota bacterium]